MEINEKYILPLTVNVPTKILCGHLWSHCQINTSDLKDI